MNLPNPKTTTAPAVRPAHAKRKKLVAFVLTETIEVRTQKQAHPHDTMSPPRHRHHLLLLACSFSPLLLFLLAGAATSAAAASSTPEYSASSSSSAVSPADFVRRSCRSTAYPRVCELTLLPRAPGVGRSPRRLARAALLVGADRARNCSAFIVHSIHGGAGGAMKDAAERLRQSAAALAGPVGRAGSPRFAWALSNVQTWASAALTDTSTCLDSLAGAVAGQGQQQQQKQKQKKKKDGDDGGVEVGRVKRRVVGVAQATSNALALVNRLQPAAAAAHHL